ncbi:MAG: group II truncated hemoglobin [Ilumatobacteraceae bacterium]
MEDTAHQDRKDQLRAELAEHTMYELLGGEDGIRSIVDRFYGLMDRDEAYAPIRSMHQADLSAIRQGLFEYLSGWLGGPQLFLERKGSPCIASAHAPFHIDAEGARLWVRCMDAAMAEAGVPLRYAEALLPALAGMSNMLRSA